MTEYVQNKDDCRVWEPVVEKSAESDKSFDRGRVLLDALKVINGERQNSYGNPEDNFAIIAEMWSTYLAGRYNAEFYLKAQDVALMMTLLKVARVSTGTASKDSFIDAAGYIGLAADMQGA